MTILRPVRHEKSNRTSLHQTQADSLSLTHHVLFAAAHAQERVALADELIRVASAAGDGVLGLMGLCWRAADLFQLGDPRAGRALLELRDRADALACRSILYIAEVMEVMLLIRSGWLAEAEARAWECHQLGRDVGDVDALGYLAGQLLNIRWIQGRGAELIDMAEEFASSPTLPEAHFAYLAAVAALATQDGDHDRARSALERLRGRGLSSLQESSTWLTGMFAIVEAAAGLGDGDLAAEAYALLLPYADLAIVPSLAVCCFGSVNRSLGLAAMTAADTDVGVRHLERAVAANDQLANRPLSVISRADLAEALRRRDGDGDRQRAWELFSEAVTQGRKMGLEARAHEWEAALSQLMPLRQQTGFMRRESGQWLVGLGDRRFVVPDLVGMGYLARMLASPGVPIPALSLAGSGAVAPEPSSQEILDDRARAAYERRARELIAELAEADDNADLGRKERLRLELDALVSELEGATKLGGRSRTFSGPGERARTAVRKAIKRALDEIEDADPEVGTVLRSAVSTGESCCYQPDPDLPVTWTVSLSV